MGKKHFGFFQTAETGKRNPNSGVKDSGANHYPRAPARDHVEQCRSAPNSIRETLRPEFEPDKQCSTMQHSQFNVNTLIVWGVICVCKCLNIFLTNKHNVIYALAFRLETDSILMIGCDQVNMYK